MIIPLAGHKYLEVVEVLNHPASDKAPFGQAVRARSEAGGGWMGWCVEVDDLAPFEERLGRAAVNGNRKFPDGRELVWKQIGILGLIADPQVPYMLKWEGDPELHPSNAYASNVKMSALTIAGSAERVTEWLGEPGGEAAGGRRGELARAPRHARHPLRHLRDRLRSRHDLTLHLPHTSAAI